MICHRVGLDLHTLSHYTGCLLRSGAPNTPRASFSKQRAENAQQTSDDPFGSLQENNLNLKHVKPGSVSSRLGQMNTSCPYLIRGSKIYLSFFASIANIISLNENKTNFCINVLTYGQDLYPLCFCVGLTS